MIAAGLVAQEALRHGLQVDPRIKTTFAPGSHVVTQMLEQSGLQSALDAQGFQVAGFGCMTCMGNSGPLDPAVEDEISVNDLAVAAVLSGNRNFEGRVHPLCRLTYLASPPLVVAFALAGRMDIDLSADSLGTSHDGRPVRLADLWPSTDVLDQTVAAVDAWHARSQSLVDDREAMDEWRESVSADVMDAERYPWDTREGFIRRPPFLDGDLAGPQLTGDIRGARPLLILGDSVTTDHISPVSRIGDDSEAGRWLAEQGVPTREYASFSARRLNHEVMLRGGFPNPRLQNLMAPGTEGGVTTLMPDGTVVPVHQAARTYRERGVPTVVVAGDRYGAGSARDWAAKVTRLLGIGVVIARGFERIHRSNLIAMGVLPLRLPESAALALDGSETLDLVDLLDATLPGGRCLLRVHHVTGAISEVELLSMVMTPAEVVWMRHGGLLAMLGSTAGS